MSDMAELLHLIRKEKGNLFTKTKLLVYWQNRPF
jgi:hypothetical protein